MKFKAVIENPAGPGSSRNAMILVVLQAMQRLERSSERRREQRGAPANIVMKLTKEIFAFCHRAGADEGSQTWSHFQLQKIFTDYTISSKRGDKIDLEAPIANLIHVFQGCANSERTTLRLATGRDHRPILSFEFTMPGNTLDHQVAQEVPVRVIPEAEAETISEPQLAEPQYQMEMTSSLRHLRNVLDKMRAVGAQHVAAVAEMEKKPADLSVSATPPGMQRARLQLVADAELVCIRSTFPALQLVMEGKMEPSPEGPVKLNLSLRRLGEVLAAFQTVSAEAHIACVLEDKALVLYALLPQSLGSMISYTPVVEV